MAPHFSQRYWMTSLPSSIGDIFSSLIVTLQTMQEISVRSGLRSSFIEAHIEVEGRMKAIASLKHSVSGWEETKAKRVPAEMIGTLQAGGLAGPPPSPRQQLGN